MKKNLSQRLDAVMARIHSACQAAGRSFDDVRLLAVGKRHGPEAIAELYRCGQHTFAESYVGEGVAKIEALSELKIEWHYIGPIQSNKTRDIATHFDWVQSVDRAKIVRRLASQRPRELAPLHVLVQVNIDQEPQKAGCHPDEINDLAAMIADCPQLKLRGLMAIPAPREGLAGQRAVFARLKDLFEDLKQEHPGVDTLSAGMSDDLEAAITEGSTMVRVGTALFGPRD